MDIIIQYYNQIQTTPRFQRITDNYYFFIIWYIVILILLVFLINRNIKQTLNLKEIVVKQIDKIFYKISYIIYKNKDKIHDFENITKTLYWHKQEILSDENPSFVKNIKLIRQDISYFEQLLNTKIEKDEERSNIFIQCSNIQKKYKTYWLLKVITTIFSMWMWILFTKDLRI